MKTSDYNLCAFALCKGATLSKIDRSSHKAVFHLEGDFNSEHIKKLFWENYDIGVHDFISAQRKVKSQLFSDSF